MSGFPHPMRLARGSHQPGSGKGCAMNVVSYMIGDDPITDYPRCSAPPLSLMVQMCNDSMAQGDGYLSPADSIIAVDLGWKTIGTTGAGDAVVSGWLADVIDDPRWGLAASAGPFTELLHHVARLHRAAASGQLEHGWRPRARMSREWRIARFELIKALGTFGRFGADPSDISRSHDRTREIALDAVFATIEHQPDASSRNLKIVVRGAQALGGRGTTALPNTRRIVEYTSWAIDRWRHLQGIGPATAVNGEAVCAATRQL